MDETLDSSSSSSFQCSICLDLLYKPVVLACGHISCFWCVHKTMDVLQASRCPICRRSYSHFPAVCQLLHFMLLKVEHEEYKRREKEVGERRNDNFSPQFSDPLESKNVRLDVVDHENHLNINGNIGSEVISSTSSNGLVNEGSRKLSLDDVICPICRELLFRPVVLNCGHVYCQPCLSDGRSDHIKCLVCESIHYEQFPNCCFDLDRFVEETFPSEYATRRKKIELEEAQCLPSDSSSSGALLSQAEKDGRHKYLVADRTNTHIGVGCDSCGVYPIVGKRFRCKDCKERVGFDLCEPCYGTTSKLPGRFNQQHTPDHTFELDETRLWLLPRTPQTVRGRLGRLQAYYFDSDDDLDDSE